MGGKGSGQYKRTEYHRSRNFVANLQNPENVNPELNSRIVRFGQRLLAFDDVDWYDIDSVKQRFYDYLALCDEFEVRPMVCTCAQAYGVAAKTLSEVGHNGANQHKKRLAPECGEFIKKAYTLFQSYLEISLMEEQKNPVKWFFLAKNYFGYEDQTVQVKRVEGDISALPLPEDVMSKYALKVGKQHVIEGEVIEVKPEVK